MARRQPFCQKFKKKIKIAYRCEMGRNEIESDFRTSKMAAGSHFEETKLKLRIDMKWREMRSKVNFRSTKMAAGSYFVKKKELCIDLKWREMRSKVIFGHPKWTPTAILVRKNCVYCSETVGRFTTHPRL